MVLQVSVAVTAADLTEDRYSTKQKLFNLFKIAGCNYQLHSSLWIT
jgi:hypothetical protein